MTGFDKSKPYMAVRHTQGRCKKEHFHVVGVPKDGFDHLTHDKVSNLYDQLDPEPDAAEDEEIEAYSHRMRYQHDWL